MKKNIIIIVVAIVLVAISVFFYFWALNYNSNNEVTELDEIEYEEEVSKTKDLENISYTEFTFYKEDGTEVKFSDYKDKATMILFWNPNVEDSVAVLRKVNSMYETYKDKINFIMISTSEKVDEELKKEMLMEIYYDFYKEGTVKYNITETPSMIYISEDNKIFNAKYGFTTSDALEANLDLISKNY